jgi:hypothetical protein
VGTSPNITTNWIASGGKWTVPLGGGFGKVVRLGEQPIKLDLDAYYNVIRPKAGDETWLLQITLTFLFSGLGHGAGWEATGGIARLVR